MLKLDDLVALAKQGYKPSDVKELIELSKEASKEPETQTPPAEPAKEEPTPVQEPEQGKTAQATEEDDPKIIEYKKKLEEMEKKISDLQKANTHRDMSGQENNKSDAEVFAEAMRHFM